MKKTKALLLAFTFALATIANAQKTTTPVLKTIVATYDSALAYSEIGWVYFTTEKDKKIIQFQPPSEKGNRNVLNEFWLLTPNKTDPTDGTEWHTSGHKGTKYELTYITKKIDGEGGMMDVNIIQGFDKYDSTYINFKVKYENWKKENAKFEVLNKAANPGAVAKKYIEVGKTGDLKALKAICEPSEANKQRYMKGVYAQLERFDKLASKNTPEGTKMEIGKQFLSGFENVLDKPVVYYIDKDNACVAVDGKGKKLYYINVSKIGGQWKVTKADDEVELNPSASASRGDVEARNFAKSVMIKRAEELNPKK